MNATALVCSAILGLLLFGLGFAVSVLRFRENRLVGVPDDPTNFLFRVCRAHGNTAEFAPLLVVLFLYLGSHDPSDPVLWLIIAATAARVLLVVGLIAWPSAAKPNPLRFTGALGTYLAGAGLCLALLGT